MLVASRQVGHWPADWPTSFPLRPEGRSFSEVFDDHPEVLKGVREILAICKAHHVPNGWFHTTVDNVEQVIQEGYRVLMAPSSRSYAVLQKGRSAAGRPAA